jgi:hypothetical protein
MNVQIPNSIINGEQRPADVDEFDGNIMAAKDTQLAAPGEAKTTQYDHESLCKREGSGVVDCQKE